MPFQLLPDGNIQQWVGVYDEKSGLQTSTHGPLYRPSDPEYEHALMWLVSEDEARARAHLEAYRRDVANEETDER